VSVGALFQHVLSEFVNIEMVFHSKALEFLTNCYKTVNLMDEDKDLEVTRLAEFCS
jgi:hypothetical protein